MRAFFHHFLAFFASRAMRIAQVFIHPIRVYHIACPAGTAARANTWICTFDPMLALFQHFLASLANHAMGIAQVFIHIIKVMLHRPCHANTAVVAGIGRASAGDKVVAFQERRVAVLANILADTAIGNPISIAMYGFAFQASHTTDTARGSFSTIYNVSGPSIFDFAIAAIVNLVMGCFITLPLFFT